MEQSMEISNSTLALFKMWNTNGIHYCHWKSNEHILPGLQGKTDLDILISPEDADKATISMINCCFKRVISHKWKLYSGVEDWIGMDSDTTIQTHLHIHYRLLTGLKNVKEQYFPWTTIVLENVIKHENYDIFVCNPNVEIILLAIRVAIKKDCISASRHISWGTAEKKEYEYLKERSRRTDTNQFAKKMMSLECAESCMTVLDNINDVKNLKNFRRLILKELPMYQRDSRAKASFKFYSRQIFYKMSKLINKPVKLKKNVYTGGKLISFIGVDGAGKTTLATFSAKWLSWKINCQYVYLGTGDGRSSLLNRLKKKAISKGDYSSTKADQHKETSVTKQLSISKQIKMVLNNYISLSNARYKYKTIKKIFGMINRGMIVITDRYPQMQFDGVYDGMVVTSFKGNGFLTLINEHIKKKEILLYEKMCSVSPDVVVKLEIPVEVSLERKPCTGRALEQVKQKVDITPKLHFGDAKEYVITPIGAIEDTKREVCNLLWRLI